MDNKHFLATIRQLALCYQAFDRFSTKQLQGSGLSHRQFDIIATLGNTPGMSPKELGERTLITKGTLTGVINRLVDKNLVQRIPSPLDGRSQIIQLTPAGEAKFDEMFPLLLAAMGKVFTNFKASDYQRVQNALQDLRAVFINEKVGDDIDGDSQ